MGGVFGKSKRKREHSFPPANGMETHGTKGVLFSTTVEKIMDYQKEEYPSLEMPFLVHFAVRNLVLHGLHQKGLTRVTGSFGEMQKIKIAVDNGEPFDFFDVSRLTQRLGAPHGVAPRTPGSTHARRTLLRLDQLCHKE